MTLNPTRRFFTTRVLALPRLMIAAMALALATQSVSAATRTKAATGTDLALAAAWDALPTTTDIATWSSGSLGGALTLGATQTWGALDFESATTAPSLSGSALTLSGGQSVHGVANSGIYVAAAGQDVTVANNIALGANQTWTVDTGRTLTHGGVLSGTYDLTKSGEGTLNLGSFPTTGSMTVNGGTLAMSSTLSLASGQTFTGTSGACSNSSASGLLVAGGGTFSVASGTYNFSSNAGWAANGGTYTQTGGTVTFAQKGLDGSQGAACSMSVTGGSLTMTNAASYINITNNTTGTMTIGGTGTVDTPTLYFMHPSLATGAGTLNLNTGGTLAVNVASPVATAR